MPEIFLRLSAPPVFLPSLLEHSKVHACVRLAKFKKGQLNFIPPDGSFELLSYTISDFSKEPPLAVFASQKKTSDKVTHLDISFRATFSSKSGPASVKVSIPIAGSSVILDSKVSQGSLKRSGHSSGIDVAVWEIPRARAEILYSCQLDIQLPTDVSLELVTVKYKIPNFSFSTISISGSKISEKSHYSALTWARHLAQGTINVGLRKKTLT